VSADGSSEPTVSADGSSEPTVSADGSSEPTVSAVSALPTSGSSEPTVSADGSLSAESADGLSNPTESAVSTVSTNSLVSTDNCNLQLKQLCSQYYNDAMPAVKEINSIAGYDDEQQDRALCAKHALNNMFKNNIFVSIDDGKEYKINADNADKDRDNQLRNLLRKTDTDTINLYSICKILEAYTIKMGQSDTDPCSTGGSYSYADVTTALSIAGYKFSELASNTDINLSIASIQNALKANPIGIILTTGELNGGHFITIRRTENTNEYEIVDSLKLGSKDAIFNANNANEILSAWFTNNNVKITPNGMIVIESFIGKYIPPYDQSMGQHTLYVDATGKIYQTIGVLYNKPFLEDITQLFCVKPYINNNSDERLNTPAIDAFNSWDAEISKADIAERTAMRYNETRPENIALVDLLSDMGDSVKHVDSSTVELKSGKGEYVEISMDILNDYVNHIMNGSPIGSTIESASMGTAATSESNTALKAAEALKKYECDPNNITDDVPDDENEADKKFDNLNDSILYCSDENKTQLLDKWSTYIDNFEKKFNKKPRGFTISNECVNLFVGEMNYNIVPDTKEKAEEKFGQYIEMMNKDTTDNGGKCATSIDAALKIYMDNMNKMYPSDQSETTSVSDDKTDSSSESDDQSVSSSESDESMNEEEQQMNLSNDQSDSTSSQPSIITSDDITGIFTKIKDNQEKDTISMVKFIKFLVNETDNDSIMVRKAIGFDEPFTMTELVSGKDAYESDLPSLAKNSQIFNSLFKTYTEFENENKMGGADNDSNQSSNLTEINQQLFAKFINCGQYRNKSENIFDCKAVKIPNQSSTGENEGADQDQSQIQIQIDGANPTTAEPNNNIVLELHEKEYNDEFKRVTIDVLIRKDAAKDIMVKDYTGNSAIETLANIASSPN
jgi:hypothetical protein